MRAGKGMAAMTRARRPEPQGFPAMRYRHKLAGYEPPTSAVKARLRGIRRT